MTPAVTAPPAASRSMPSLPDSRRTLTAAGRKEKRRRLAPTPPSVAFSPYGLARRARHDGGVGVAVLGPGRLVRTFRDRTFLAEADGVDAGGGHAAADQIGAHGLGAAGAQGQVVFARAAFVGVAFNADRDLRIAGQPGGLGVQTRLGLGADRIGVEVEIDAGRSGERRG